MLRSISVLLPTARLAVLLPFALAAAACAGSEGDDAASDDAAGNGGSRASGAATGNTTATGNAASTPNGAGSGGSKPGGAGGTIALGGPASGAGGTASLGTPMAPADPGVATAALGPALVRLGKAGDYAILAQAAISNVPTSAINGALGLSPAAASYITGFALTRAGTMWTSPEVSAGVFAADSDPTTPADLTAAVSDMQAAYDDAANRPTPGFIELGGGAIGGLTLVPGLYKWTSTVTIPADVTLAGGAEDAWIFQIAGDLTLSAGQRMTLNGGAQARNIVWQVAGAVDLGATSHAEGIVLSKTAIHAGTGASVNGRLLAQTAVTLASTSVTAPAQ